MARATSRKKRNCDTPRVIRITANEGGRPWAYAKMLGVDDYLHRPLAMDQLLESVQRLCPLEDLKQIHDAPAP